MDLGYQNPFYLKQAQQKQQSLYNGKVLLEKHDPPAVYDSKETLQLAQEIRLKMKQLNKEIKPCEECKYDKISLRIYACIRHDNYNIERLQAQLGDLKGKSKDTSCVSNTLDPLSQKLENENVELEFQVLNYAKENAHLKTTYKNLFDSISVTQAQTKIIIDSLQDKLLDTIYENTKLRAQLFDKVSKQEDTTKGTSTNTKFANQSTERKLSMQPLKNNFVVRQPNAFQSERTKFSKTRVPQKVDETNDLSNPVTSNSVPTTQESKVVKSDNLEQVVGNLKLLINFLWKFLGTARFGNDHIAAILDYGDLQWGNILITRVYFVEGLGHNLFSVGQFCDSDLEVAFRRNTSFIKNLEGVDLLKGNHTTNLYTINLHETASASPICLMARATSTKSWLWHQRLSHLNFDTINDLAKNDLVIGLPQHLPIIMPAVYRVEGSAIRCCEGESVCTIVVMGEEDDVGDDTLSQRQSQKDGCDYNASPNGSNVLEDTWDCHRTCLSTRHYMGFKASSKGQWYDELSLFSYKIILQGIIDPTFLKVLRRLLLRVQASQPRSTSKEGQKDFMLLGTVNMGSSVYEGFWFFETTGFLDADYCWDF
ncbi:retrovirus-related pol polyprotein from transposon TNT 1-94 [Tanacetum coccineum]|uniref:Retrovirus-related pol polyprotein from transposon TNT 1-94 n=1 Tax=Tanacetum coccineum TaxID=301880 RepID=A0ABQ4ZI44_9ASTR